MAVAARPIAAHPLPLEVQVYVFQAENQRISAVARIPAAFLAEARLPRREDGYLDLANIDGPMSGVAAYVARTLDLMIDGKPLAATLSHWTLTRPENREYEHVEFVSTEAAKPRPSPDVNVNPDTMVVLLSFDYALPAGVDPGGHLSIRANDFRAPNQNVQMRIQPVSRGNPGRAIVTKGTPRRIDLNPARLDALGFFARRGLEHVRLSGPIALFLLCLAIARRPLDETIRHFAAFALGCVVTLGVAAVAGGSAPFLGVLQAAAGGLLVIAALQNITGARAIWIWNVALVFGAVEGFLLGDAFALDAALAGTHAVGAFFSYVAPVVAGALLLLMLARVLVDAVGQTRLQERWAVLLLSAIPIHSGLHGILGGFGFIGS